MDQIIDSFSSRIVYKKAIFVVNKVDTSSKHKNSDYIYISAEKEIGIEELKEKIWNELGLVTIYLVEKAEKPDTSKPIVMKDGDTLEDVATSIGSEFRQGTTIAKIWGNGARFDGQEMPLTTKVKDKMMVRFI